MNKEFPSVLVGYDRSRRPVLIEDNLRSRHLYVLGRSGTGKSTLIHNMILEDIDCGGDLAVTLIDPAGDLAIDVLKSIPESKIKDVVYFSMDSVIPCNILQTRSKFPERVIQEFIDLIDRVTTEQSSTQALSTRMKRLLRRCLQVLIKKGDASILDIESFLMDKEHRYSMLSRVKVSEPELLFYWKKGGVYDGSFRELRVTIDSILDRIDNFVSDKLVRSFTCGGNELDFDGIIDQNKIFIVNLSGLEGSLKRFVGSLIVHGLERAAMERQEERRKPVSFYVDEFQNYITSGFEIILSQGRKYLISLCLAHQNHSQIPEKLLGSVLGNVGCTLVFNCGAQETRRMRSEFGPDRVETYEFLDLENYSSLVRKGNSISWIKTFPPPEPVRDNIDLFIRSIDIKDTRVYEDAGVKANVERELNLDSDVGSGWMYFGEEEGR